MKSLKERFQKAKRDVLPNGFLSKLKLPMNVTGGTGKRRGNQYSASQFKHKKSADSDSDRNNGSSWSFATESLRDSQNVFLNDEIEPSKIDIELEREKHGKAAGLDRHQAVITTPNGSVLRMSEQGYLLDDHGKRRPLALLQRRLKLKLADSGENGTSSGEVWKRAVRLQDEDDFLREDERRMVRVARLANRASRGSAEACVALCSFLQTQIASVEAYVFQVRHALDDTQSCVNALPDKLPSARLSRGSTPGKFPISPTFSPGSPLAFALSPGSSISGLNMSGSLEVSSTAGLEEEDAVFARRLAMERLIWQMEAAIRELRLMDALNMAEGMRRSRSSARHASDSHDLSERLDSLIRSIASLIEQRSNRRIVLLLGRVDSAQRIADGERRDALVDTGFVPSSDDSAMILEARCLVRLAHIGAARTFILRHASARFRASLSGRLGASSAALVFESLFVHLVAASLETGAVLDPETARAAGALMTSSVPAQHLHAAANTNAPQGAVKKRDSGLSRRRSTLLAGLIDDNVLDVSNIPTVDLFDSQMTEGAQKNEFLDVNPETQDVAMLSAEDAEAAARSAWQLVVWMTMEIDWAYYELISPFMTSKQVSESATSRLIAVIRSVEQMRNAFGNTERVKSAVRGWIGPRNSDKANTDARLREEKVENARQQARVIYETRLLQHLEVILLEALDKERADMVEMTTRSIKADDGELASVSFSTLFSIPSSSTQDPNINARMKPVESDENRPDSLRAAGNEESMMRISTSCAEISSRLWRFLSIVEPILRDDAYYANIMACVCEPLEAYLSYVGQSRLVDSIVSANRRGLAQLVIPALLDRLSGCVEYALPQLETILLSLTTGVGLQVARASTGSAVSATSRYSAPIGTGAASPSWSAASKAPAPRPPRLSASVAPGGSPYSSNGNTVPAALNSATTGAQQNRVNHTRGSRAPGVMFSGVDGQAVRPSRPSNASNSNSNMTSPSRRTSISLDRQSSQDSKTNNASSSATNAHATTANIGGKSSDVNPDMIRRKLQRYRSSDPQV